MIGTGSPKVVVTALSWLLDGSFGEPVPIMKPHPSSGGR